MAEDTEGFAPNGELADDGAGSVSGAEEVNGDGLDDVVIGASGSDVSGEDSGRTCAVFGKADTAVVVLSSIAAGLGGSLWMVRRPATVPRNR